MPKRRDIGIDEAESLLMFVRPPALTVRVAEQLRSAKTIVLEESLFSDPGDDYCALYTDGELAVRIRGY
jgi:hypothetical protein